MKKTFYVCSYGGCGSKMLTGALNQYGKAIHIHSRNPPDKLEYVGSEAGGKVYKEWFNGIPIPEDKLETYYVIYIYKNPIKSILSRFHNPVHLEHIQTKRSIKLNNVLTQQKDLYGIKEFYRNYTDKKRKRNYKIISVKYEDIFEKQDELSAYLGIGKLNLKRKETKRHINKVHNKVLNKIYGDLIREMEKNEFITVI